MTIKSKSTTEARHKDSLLAKASGQVRLVRSDGHRSETSPEVEWRAPDLYRREKTAGQALVEYVLMVAVLLSIMIAANKLFSNALTGYFEKVAFLRSGITGMGP